MKKPKLIILTIIVALTTAVGCKHKELPAGVMDTATMTAFLTEMHLIEAYDHTIVSQNRDSLGHELRAIVDSTYVRYRITPSDYDSSMAYYLRNPKLLEAIYTEVDRRLKAYLEENPYERGSEMDNAGNKHRNPFTKTEPTLNKQ